MIFNTHVSLIGFTTLLLGTSRALFAFPLLLVSTVLVLSELLGVLLPLGVTVDCCFLLLLVLSTAVEGGGGGGGGSPVAGDLESATSALLDTFLDFSFRKAGRELSVGSSLSTLALLVLLLVDAADLVFVVDASPLLEGLIEAVGSLVDTPGE